MAEEKPEVPEDDDQGMQLQQSMYNHIAARGDAAMDKPAKERTDEDWQDIDDHRATFGKLNPAWEKEYRALDDYRKKKGDEENPSKKKKSPGAVLHDNPRSNSNKD